MLWQPAQSIVSTLACIRQAWLGHSEAEACGAIGCYGKRHISACLRWLASGKRRVDIAMLRHAVAFGCYGNRHISSCLRWLALGKRSLDTAMLRHAVAYGCYGNRYISSCFMLACIRQAQLGHSDAEARRGIWLRGNRHISTYLYWLAVGKHSLDTVMLSHAVTWLPWQPAYSSCLRWRASESPAGTQR